MASFRNLRSSISTFSLLNSTNSGSGARRGFSRGFRSHTVLSTSDQEILRFDDYTAGTESEPDYEEVRKIRQKFDAAKLSFLKIPETLRTMPKLNPEGIYVNKNLSLDNIQVYGFDYDYTLAHYSANLQSLIYDLAKQHLVNELRYPESCMTFKYDPTFPIRGLYYDKLKGCLLKLDFFGSIEPDGCYFGRRKLSLEKIKEIYGTRHIGRDQARGLVGLMDFFCFSEVSQLPPPNHVVINELKRDKHAGGEVKCISKLSLSSNECYLAKRGNPNFGKLLQCQCGINRFLAQTFQFLT